MNSDSGFDISEIHEGSLEGCVVHTTKIRALAWTSAAFCLFLAFLGWQDNQLEAARASLVFSGLSLLLLLKCGTIEISREQIVFTTPRAKHGIRWDEVIEIQRAEQDSGLVFIGADKQLVLPGVSYWSVSKSPRTLEVFFGEIRKRQIPVVKNWKAGYMRSRNTQI
ncbi:MAG TPA: hypothetical protein VF719_07830 [Abditibacteriaceae bacterium]|jgi:hypothetical protein